MSTNSLPAHVQSQIGRLTAAERKRLVGIIGDFLSSFEKVNEINVGAEPVESWGPAIRKLSASLDQMKALVEVPAVLPTIAPEGPNGNGIGLHLHPEMWLAHATERNNLAREVLAWMKDESEEHDEENSIQLVGKVWELRYGNERGGYPERGHKCIPWLRTILSHPRRSLTVAEVRGDPEGRLAGDALLHGERATDAAGIRAIRLRQEEIADIRAETGGSPSLDEEEAELLQQLQEASKQIKSPLRKAHHNIASQIRAFLRDKLAKDMPDLAAHLTAALKLDSPHFGYYPPVGAPAWKI
jgi:hypothetical protein